MEPKQPAPITAAYSAGDAAETKWRRLTPSQVEKLAAFLLNIEETD